MIDGIIRGVRHLLVGAIDGRTGGIDEVLDTPCAVVVRVAAGLENVIEADEVALDIDVGVGDGVPHPRLRRQIDDDIGMIGVEDVLDHLFVRDAAAEKDPFGSGSLGESVQLPQAVLLQGDVVIVVDAVDADDRLGVMIFEELFDEVRPDKSGCSGD